MKNMKGFTLIELMIVIAILGILLAIAIPAYQDYVIRSKVSEGLMTAAGAKTSTAEFIISQGELPSSTSEAGFSSVTTSYVTGMTWTGTLIQVDINEVNTGMGSSATATTITLTPTTITTDGVITAVSWDCSSTGEIQYVPASCR